MRGTNRPGSAPPTFPDSRKRSQDSGDSPATVKYGKFSLSCQQKQSHHASIDNPSETPFQSGTHFACPIKQLNSSTAGQPADNRSKTFDFKFVSSDQHIENILSSDSDDEAQSILVQSEDGLTRDNLVKRLTVFEGQHRIEPGKLFGSDHVRLYLDIRNIPAEEISRFNDLLDPETPCLYFAPEKKKLSLGPNVHITVLADLDQIPRTNISSTQSPAADFWRRINRPDNTWEEKSTTEDSATPMETDRQGILPPCTNAQLKAPETVIVNFHLSADWRRTLYGGVGIDEQGRIGHRPGILETLTGHQKVIFKGADWSDLEFRQHIRQLLIHGKFESNGHAVALKSNIQFFQCDIDEREMEGLFQSVHLQTDFPEQPLIINQGNLSQWLAQAHINNDGYFVSANNLANAISRGQGIAITSYLTDAQWFLLLGCLQEISEQTGRQPSLHLAHPDKQPEALQRLAPPELSSKPDIKVSQQVNLITFDNAEQVRNWIRTQDTMPLVIRVNAGTRLNQLFDQLYIRSEKNALFGSSQTEMQIALHRGTPLCILGLETNPALQQSLESMLCPPHSIMVNGNLQQYPKARLTLFWPENQPPQSTVWKSAMKKAEQCVDIDLLQAAADRHQISRDQIPDTAFDAIYKAYNTVPARMASRIGKLPALTPEFLDVLISAARQASGLDKSTAIEPRHWRKAIDSTLTHVTRRVPEVRDFMKFACEWLLPDEFIAPDWVDPEDLAYKLNALKRIDRQYLDNNFWYFARSFGPGAFQKLKLGFTWPNIPYSDIKATETLNDLVARYAPDSLFHTICLQLKLDPEAIKAPQLRERSLSRRKRLEDALCSGWSLNTPAGETQTSLIESIAVKALAIARQSSVGFPQKVDQLIGEISQNLEWIGPGSPPLDNLAADLVAGQIDVNDYQQRRKARLSSRLEYSPVLFIEGITGAGKSTFSSGMAKSKGPTTVISVGPSIKEGDLLHHWEWKYSPDGHDRYMELLKKNMLEWAEYIPESNDRYVTLVIDEANLTLSGVLDTVKGLWEQPPCIFCDGQPVKVSTRHRIIFTGNPSDYAGRNIEPALRGMLQRVHYPPLKQAFIKGRVIEPALRKILAPYAFCIKEPGINAQPALTELCDQLSESILTLWNQYRILLPDHEYTPRDLTDVCAWIEWYLQVCQKVTGSGPDSLTANQINALIMQSFHDVLGYGSECQSPAPIVALQSWFKGRYPVDEELLAEVRKKSLGQIYNHFKFYAGLNQPEFDTSSETVMELAAALGQDLERSQLARCSNLPHRGRKATLIEGPTGRGKDVTLRLAVECHLEQVRFRREPVPGVSYISAKDCPWDRLQQHIRQAQAQGDILIISEMNLIDSQYLEGELNDILAGDSNTAPGFHLFATVNPPTYTGRKPLSPALRGRFRNISIRSYNQEELTRIAGKHLPPTESGKQLAAKLAGMHCRLRSDLQKKSVALQPASQDLKTIAADTACQSGDDALKEAFTRHYKLYLLAAGTNTEQLFNNKPGPSVSGTVDDFALTRWLNKSFPALERPFIIVRGAVNKLDASTSVITVSRLLSDDDARHQIIKQLGRLFWQESGLRIDPPESLDTLTQTIYRYWQQSWFRTFFGEAGQKWEKIDFPTDTDQTLTLELDANRPYFRAVDQLLCKTEYTLPLQKPVLWEQIKQLLQYPAIDISGHRQEVNEQPKIQMRTSNHLTSMPETEISVLDRETNYRNMPLPTVYSKKIFNSAADPRMYRLKALHVKASQSGNIEKETIPAGVLGFDVILPGNMNSDGPIPLASKQNYGTTQVDIIPNRWNPIPSLTFGEKIVSVCTEPKHDIKVLRDRYTGLHLFYFPDATVITNVKIHFIVEAPDTGAKTGKTQTEISANPVQPEAVGLYSYCDNVCSLEVKREIETVLSPDNLSRLAGKNRYLLEDLLACHDDESRIDAVTYLCMQFDGTAKDVSGHSFLKYLLEQQQGSCRHRTPVFVILCKYFGISAREIHGTNHSYPEYSLDNGQTWTAVDLGGSPARLINCGSSFPPETRGRCFASGSLKKMMSNATAEQLQALALATGMSFDELKRSAQSGTAFVATDYQNKPNNIIKKLWQQGTEPAFYLGANMIHEKDVSEITFDEGYLLGCFSTKSSAVADGVEKLLSNPNPMDCDMVVQTLERLYIKGTGAKVLDTDWQFSILTILNALHRKEGGHSEIFIRFATKCLANNWLNPTYCSMAEPTLEVLKKIEAVDALKPLAENALRNWYSHWLALGGVDIIDWQKSLDGLPPRFVQGSHGESKTLKESLKASCISQSWTDVPEGIPDHERLLTGEPAFTETGSSALKHRPTILLSSGYLDWEKAGLEIKTQQFLQYFAEHNPEIKKLLEKKKQIDKLMQQRNLDLECLDSQTPEKRMSIFKKYKKLFKQEGVDVDLAGKWYFHEVLKWFEDIVKTSTVQYLFEETSHHGGQLVISLFQARPTRVHFLGTYGSYKPDSAKELLCFTEHNHCRMDMKLIDDHYIRYALQSNDALVLRGNNLTQVVTEYIDSLSIESLYQEVSDWPLPSDTRH